MQPLNFPIQNYRQTASAQTPQRAEEAASLFHHLPITETEQREFIQRLNVGDLERNPAQLTEVMDNFAQIQWTARGFSTVIAFAIDACRKNSIVFEKILETFEKSQNIYSNSECQKYFQMAIIHAGTVLGFPHQQTYSSVLRMVKIILKPHETDAPERVQSSIAKLVINHCHQHLESNDENSQEEIIALFGQADLNIDAQRRIVASLSLGKFRNSKRILESFVEHILPKLDLNDSQIQDCFFCTRDSGNTSDSGEESSSQTSEERSFLNTLFNSESCTLDEKLSLMEVFFQKLKEHPNINFLTNPITTILSDVFCSHIISAQLNNPHIAAQFPESIAYLNHMILSHFMEPVKDQILRECLPANEINFFLYICNIFFQNPEISLIYNSILNQIKYICKTEQDDGINNHFYHNIYLPYLNHVSPNTITALNRTLNGDGDTPDGEELFSLLDELYFFIADDGTSAIACEHDYYTALMNKQKPTAGFPAFYLFQKYASDQLENISIQRPLEEIFSQFPLLNQVFQSLQTLEKFENFFHALNLEEFYGPFMEALKAPRLSADKKLIDDAIQLRLGEIFEKHLVPTDDDRALLEVNDEFLNSIYTAFDFHEKVGDEKSQLLLLISTIFLRLSSKFYFGTEDFSPEALRHIGLGLLNAAKKENDALIADDAMASLRNRIAAIGTSFECTELISNELLLVVKQSPAVSCYVPIAWM